MHASHLNKKFVHSPLSHCHSLSHSRRTQKVGSIATLDRTFLNLRMTTEEVLMTYSLSRYPYTKRTATVRQEILHCNCLVANILFKDPTLQFSISKYRDYLLTPPPPTHTHIHISSHKSPLLGGTCSKATRFQ